MVQRIFPVMGYTKFKFYDDDTANLKLVKSLEKEHDNIKIYTNLRRTLNQLVIEQRMIDQNIDVSLVGALSKKIEFETFELDDSGQASKGNELSSFLVPYLFLMILTVQVFQ